MSCTYVLGENYQDLPTDSNCGYPLLQR